ncbi:TonB-dependent receptor [Pseudomonas sp. MAFF 302046]|uniref:TonB-dependent receptor n=1 Tax=Pseudomonas morbosilactucae TaxID=2938197 RepID=A0ABT0JHK8_9PSED|nr:TonB-dependent receptor [Pseudomonas morbosilactucae]MCK9815381.1 TonB-dependent receptor [Pseudomonas morbosilactucae]
MRKEPFYTFALGALPLLGLTELAFAVQPGSETATTALDTVVVTGTRTTGTRASESLQPIDIITSEQLSSQGTADLAGALNKLLPSISVPRPHNTVGSEAVRPLVMRGLAPDQVLVLVNGKRRNNGAFLNTGGALGRGTNPTDLGAIPVSAIERVEVLRDGASARYGSDAIAGVINIILKNQREGGAINATYGRYDEGDGTRRELQGYAGLALGEHGALTVSAEGQNNEATNRAGPDTSPAARNDGLYGQTTYKVGAPALESAKLGFNAQLPINDNVELYSFGTFSRRDAQSYYSRQGKTATVVNLYPDGFLPRYDPVIEDQALVFGGRGALTSDWQYDASLDWGRNTYKPYIKSMNTALYNATGSSPTHFYNGTYETRQSVGNLNLSRAFEIGLASPLSFAFGFEYQAQDLEIKSGDDASWFGSGALAMPGISPRSAGDWSRHSLASYVDLELKPVDKLSLSVAARHENYSDFGNSLSGSLAARYDFTPRIALRGSISNGFRAPSLTQQHYSSIQTQGQDLGNGVVTVQSGTFAVDSNIARLLGAEDLKAEKSVSQTLGLILRPTDNLSLTLDAYRISVADRINLSSSLPVTSAAARQYLLDNGVTDSNYQSVRYMTNAADTRTIGADLAAEYRYRLGNGDRFKSTLGYSYNRTKVTDLAPNPSVLQQLGIPVTLVERREVGQLTDTNPRHKLIIGGDYSFTAQGLDLHAALNRYGAFWIYSNTRQDLDQKFDAKWTLDLSASYSWADHWRLSLGADNLFDVRPDRTRAENNTGGSFQYTSYSPLAADGAFYYANLNYSW